MHYNNNNVFQFRESLYSTVIHSDCKKLKKKKRILKLNKHCASRVLTLYGTSSASCGLAVTCDCDPMPA